MKLKRTRQKGLVNTGRLPMVAMIDVALFILMYFLFASELADNEARLAAAIKTDARGGGSAALQPQVVHVEPGPRGPRFRIGDRTVESRDALAGILELLPKEAGVVIRVSDDVQVSAMAAATQAAKNAGFRKISNVPASRP